MLSEADRDAAHRFLSQLASDGTRDELGLAPIHFAFADRFFPGTSVQHQQLRYVFFVAWAYQELLDISDGGNFDRDRLFEIERRYSLRLMKGVSKLQNSGINGWTKYQARERPVVRASTIYWTALRSWKIVNSIPGTEDVPTESQMQAAWPMLISRDYSDALRSSVIDLFEDMPRAPDGWRRKTGPLDLKLSSIEAEYIRRKWRQAGSGGTPPLLSRLADAGVSTKSLWSRNVLDVASIEERKLLALARSAASIACIARAAYAALVEAKRNKDLETNTRRHSHALPELTARHREAALKIDLDALRAETRMDSHLERFLQEVLEWVRNRGSLDSISRALETRERELKQDRAYLLNAKRRADWQKDVATPLDYRWPVVRQMIIRVGTGI